MTKETAVLYSDIKSNIERVYPENVVKELEEEFSLIKIYDKKELLSCENISEIKYIFTTWGMPHFEQDEVKKMKALRCVFYAAGSVQHFAREFLENGVSVFSAWAANAVPVAEYAVSQIILANKGFFGSASRAKKNHDKAKEHFGKFPGNYGANVGLLGAGMIGKLVIKMLGAYKLNVLVFDPFLPDKKAEELGVRKCSLEEIFESCTVISNHLANNAQTVGMLDYSLFSRMPENGVFINTGRGAQVVEKDLVRALREKPHRFAVLDVTYPEPPEAGHDFYSLENVILTPHIAGSSGDETHRMAEYMLDEYKLYRDGKPVNYSVTFKMLETMA